MGGLRLGILAEEIEMTEDDLLKRITVNPDIFGG